MDVTVRYQCGKCEYRWTRRVHSRSPVVLDRRIITPDCEACDMISEDIVYDAQHEESSCEIAPVEITLSELWDKFIYSLGWEDREGNWVVPVNMLGSVEKYKQAFLAIAGADNGVE